MKNSIKKNLRFSFFSLLAVFLFFSVVSCNSVKQVPVYEGMTISTNGNVATRKLNKHNEEDKENGEGHKKHDELEEDISDVVEIDIITDDSVKYYVQPNETFIVEIHISNPNDFEIQSFTLNGKKYANYMFEDGSNMELLLLEVTAPSEPGYYEYTVDAIKYIDGEEIKNVDMSKAEKTVKTGIAYTTLPTAEVVSSVIGTTSIELDINVNDIEGVIEEDKLTIELSDGEQIVASKPLVVGTNNVKFDNLLMDKTYQYGIVSIYDIIDGNGPQINWLLKDIFSTDGAFELDNFVVNQESISFELITNDENATLTSINLYDEDSGELIINGTNETKEFTNLLTNHSYYIQVNYSYINSEDTIEDSVIYENFVTRNKVAPTLEFEELSSEQTSISYKVSCEDVDGVVTGYEVSLFKGDEKVASKENVLTGTFDGLLTNTTYNLLITYHYDLNDGGGVHEGTVSGELSTLAKSVPTFEFEELSSEQTSISYKVSCEDNDQVIINYEIVLLENAEQKNSKGDSLEGIFENLVINTLYTIKVNYQYDLGDGNGSISESVEKNYVTTAHNVGVEEILVLNEGIVRVGEEMNLRIYFDNPSNIELTGIYVNNQLVEVVGGNRISNAIIKFVPKTDGGYFNFFVDKVDYISHEIEITQHIKDNVSTEYPIFGELNDIEFTQLSVSPYCVTTPYILMEFDNSASNYTIFSINDTENFDKLADGKYIVYTNEIRTIEYGYEGFGSTIQQINHHFSWSNFNIQNIEYIYSEEDFLNISGSNYYILMNDLDFRKMPGTTTLKFNGIINGNGHSIRGLSIIKSTIPNEQDLGVFSGGLFYDLSFEELYISYHSFHVLGPVTVYNCYIEGDVIAEGYSEEDILCEFEQSNEILVRFNLDGKIKTISQTAVKKEVESNVVYENGCYYFDVGDDQYLLFTVDDMKEVAISEKCVLALPNSFNKNLDSYKNIVEEIYFLGNTRLAKGYNLNFEGYSSLRYIEIPEGVTTIYYNSFNNMHSLEEIKLPSTLTKIEGSAFSYTSIKDIEIPNSVKEIEGFAFTLIESLENVYFSGTIEEWLEIYFENDFANPLSNYSNLYVLDENGDVEYNGKKYSLVETLIIPETITEINDVAFWGCSSIKEIIIHENVTKIGYYAFSWCENAKVYCEVESKPEGWDVDWNADGGPVLWKNMEVPVEYGNELYIYDGEIKSIEVVGLPSFIKIEYENNYQSEIGEYVVNVKFTSLNDYFVAPDDMSAILIITSEEDLLVIDSFEFGYVSNIDGINGYYKEQVSFGGPETVEVRKYIYVTTTDEIYKIIGLSNGAFQENETVANVILPESIAKIGELAFVGCYSLTNVVIPSSVQFIDSDAFLSCTALENVYFNGTLEDWCNIEFVNVNSNPMTYASNLYLLDENGDVEYNGKKYSLLEGTVMVPEGVAELNDFVFAGFNNVVEFILPEGLTFIGEYVFEGCLDLVEISIPDSVTSIGAFSFCGCKALEYIEIPEGVEIVDYFTFYYCDNLKEVVLPSSITVINSSAFANCPSLNEIVIPDSVTSIGYDAFSGCSSLTIYCEANSELSIWYSNLDGSNIQVYWAGEWQYDNEGNPVPLA